MTRGGVGPLFIVAVGTLVAWLVLAGTHVGEGWTGPQWPSPRAPFGSHGVVWAHLLAATAGCWLLTGHLPFLTRDRSGPVSRRAYGGIFLLLAGMWGWLTVQSGDSIPGWNREYSEGEAATLRVVWSVIWQFSMCAAARTWMPARSAAQGSRTGPGTWFAADGVVAVLLALIAAWVIPYVYVLDTIERATARTTQEISRERYGLAWEELRCLADLASTQPIGNETPRTALESLRSYRTQLVTAVQHSLADDAPLELKLQRARQLSQLRLWDDATAILEPLADVSPQAAWQLISLYDERGDLQQSVELASRTWQHLAAMPIGLDPNRRKLQANILVVWAHNLRRLNQFDQAQQVLQDALEQWPADDGLVHYELGYHYKESGYYHKARDAYGAAAAADSTYTNKVASELADLQSQMPFCLPRP